MNPLLESLTGQFRLSNGLMAMVLGDVRQEDAVRRSRGDDGPSITWTVGHLLEYRCRILGLLGRERQHAYASVFDGQPATDGTGYPLLADLLAEWNAVHEDLESALAAADPDSLLEANEEGGLHGEKRPLDDLVFFTWHEAYHFGALGALRKQLGYPGPAELVMAARATAE